MNLAFNFKDKIFWIHNFLPKNLYKEMYIEFIKCRNKLEFVKSSVSWRTFKEESEDMSQSFSQDVGNDFLSLHFFKKYHVLLRHQRFVNIVNLKINSHLRKYCYGEHLRWHADVDETVNRKYAATYYFNKTWDSSWGGELMFRSNEGSGFIPVVGNSLAIVKTGTEHKVNPNLKKTHPRLSIQTWISEKQGSV